MKKSIFLILGILVVSLILINGVIAEENETDENETEFCGSWIGTCNLDSDCKITGCSNETCEGQILESDIAPTVCELGECSNYTKYNRECKCVDNGCKWKKTKTTIHPGENPECDEGCECMGSVVRCTTETGRIMIITAGASGNIITITMDKTNVSTTITIEKENNKFYANTTSGRKEIKVLPDVASERAIERFKLKNFTVELKEVENKLVYEFNDDKEVRILGLFRARMRIQAQTDAESGETVQLKKPWWAFLATE